MNMVIGADHGGFKLKEYIRELLAKRQIQVEDLGCYSAESVDYPDFACAVAHKVSEGEAEQGILICTTGIGMSIMANRFPRVRAALCLNPRMARMARAHNNANVLVLGGNMVSPEEAEAILTEWLAGTFQSGGRHERRSDKLQTCAPGVTEPVALYDVDPDLYAVLRREARRQIDNLELIASENYCSLAVREAQASELTNKYAEGLPGRRWYNGCEFADEAERLAIDRARELFDAEHANVQPHSGSQANQAVYMAALEPGETILSMSLAHGGHLSHGLKTNFSGRLYHIVHYGVRRDTEHIDYDEVHRLAREHRPQLLCAGASAYPRIIDFKRLRAIADDVSAKLFVDMAHIAGLVAAGCHPSPVPYADYVTTTTHKTLRGPRGGLILCRERYADDIDRAVFPGLQGGPLMHVIAAKAVCLYEASQPAFRRYAEQVVKNAQALATALEAAGARIVSGGTDNHLMLVDLTSWRISGRDAATALDRAGITVNKNAIPFDTQSPFVTSGIRIGTSAITTRGMREPEMEKIAAWIREVLTAPEDEALIMRVRSEVRALTARFPVP